MTGFKDLNIKDDTISALKNINIIDPKPIQEKSIPTILEGKDVIAQSETGSGKTLAYLLPLIEKVDFSLRSNQFIILTPTHELALQVKKVIDSINEGYEDENNKLKALTIIGDVNIKRQVEKLRDKPQFIIGSPGRILELIKMKKIAAHTVKSIVIDECDKLLDKNNLKSVMEVIKTTLKDRQLLLFSATIPGELIEEAKKFMKDPKVIMENESFDVNPNIDHYYITCEKREKIELIRKIMAGLKPEKAIAFINNTDEIEIMVSKLKYHGLKVDGIHGTFVKKERKKAMDDFESGKINLLIASDIAARGLDIKGVTHIINIDMPEDGKEYIHRTGRCGRGNKKGTAISLITTTSREEENIRSLERKFKISIKRRFFAFGKLLAKKPSMVNRAKQRNLKK